MATALTTNGLSIEDGCPFKSAPEHHPLAMRADWLEVTIHEPLASADYAGCMPPAVGSFLRSDHRRFLTEELERTIH
jgi:hypothetical protein